MQLSFKPDRHICDPYVTDMLPCTFTWSRSCSLCRFMLKHVLCYVPQGRSVSEGLDPVSFWFPWERLPLYYIFKASVATSRNCGYV